MNGKSGRLILSVLSILFLIIFVRLFNPCFLKSKTTKDGNCYVTQAAEKNDDSYCVALEGKYENWTGNNMTGKCYTELAVLNKDTSYCNKITGHYLDITKSQCYTATAFSKNDYKVCNEYKSTYGNNFCYSWLSNKMNNPKLCSYIEDYEEETKCFWRHKEDYFSEDFFFCDELVSEKARNLCNQR